MSVAFSVSVASTRRYYAPTAGPTLDQAKAEFEASWKQWKAWSGLEEVP